MTESSAHPYDQALAATLDGDEETSELRERLLSGGAGADDRRAARERLDDTERHRFDLAHSSPPAESAQELDGGEVTIARSDLDDKKAWTALTDDLRDRVEEALEDAPEVESIVRVGVRISAEP